MLKVIKIFSITVARMHVNSSYERNVFQYLYFNFHTDRMNNAPVLGFERDAGSKTTIRLMYPEGAPSKSQEYKSTEVVALVVFKSLDLAWLTSVVTKEPLVSTIKTAYNDLIAVFFSVLTLPI